MVVNCPVGICPTIFCLLFKNRFGITVKLLFFCYTVGNPTKSSYEKDRWRKIWRPQWWILYLYLGTERAEKTGLAVLEARCSSSEGKIHIYGLHRNSKSITRYFGQFRYFSRNFAKFRYNFDQFRKEAFREILDNFGKFQKMYWVF